jgi:glucosyl-dolichyl phosphate glucuronosyltransferase
MAQRATSVSVIVCTYNRAASLGRTLQSLNEMSVTHAEDCELIVVDNNSSDSTKACVEKFKQGSKVPVRYIFESRQGKPHALNTGIQSASGEILLFTDDDVLVDKGWVSNVIKTFNETNAVGVGGKIVPVWPGGKPAWFHTEGPYGLMSAIASYDLGDARCELTSRSVPFGANVAFRKEAFERHGYYRTDLGPSAGKDRVGGGCEDTEFARRLVRSGEKLVYSPSAIVYHPVEPQRAQKRYFKLWHFEYGKSLIKVGADTPPGVQYFGVPRYLLRSLFENSFKWLVAVNSQKRFYYKLQIYLFAGEIVAAYRARSSEC